MRAGTDHRGYTILEVMIFLAVSGLMFVIAATFISGKQSKAEFKQGMNDINTKVQQVISDVSNGFYPSNSDFSCTVTAGSPKFNAPPASPQGTNQGCVFLGKVIQFGVTDSSGTENPASYNIFSVTGRQNVGNAASAAPTNFVEAQPVAVDDPGIVNLTLGNTLQWGVQVTSMYDDTPTHKIGAVGFFGSFGQYNKGSLASGAQTTVAIPLPTSQLGQKEADIANEIASQASAMDAAVASEPNPNIVICVTSGKGQFGTLTIGGANGQRLTTNIQISDTLPAGC